MRAWLVVPLLGLWGSCTIDLPDDPNGDLQDVETALSLHNGDALRKALHSVIDDHTRASYSKTWQIVETADEHPKLADHILDIYRNRTYPKGAPGVPRKFHREHSWPKSYGFPKYNKDNYPFTDAHALFAADAGYNLSRHNKPYRNCSLDCAERPVEPADLKARNQTFKGGWEVWKGRRGDVARALFYMDVRYEGGTHTETGSPEPDLILTDDLALIVSSGKENTDVAYMGQLSTLLQWHEQDPVSDEEIYRNDVVESFQGNRNPFIDNPAFAACVFLNDCD